MPLVLTLHRARDPADRQRESRTLDEGTLSIGRGPGNGWVLQDPAQHLSKTHCIVSSAPGGRYLVTDTSSNGVFLNGAKKRMPRDSKAPIADGDEFTLGDYLVQVREVQTISSRTVAASAAADPRGAPPAIDRDDPFGLDDFLAPAPAPAPPPAARAAPPPAAPHHDPFADPARSLRDDPFGDEFDNLVRHARPRHPPFQRPGAPRPLEGRPRPLRPAAPASIDRPAPPRQPRPPPARPAPPATPSATTTTSSKAPNPPSNGKAPPNPTTSTPSPRPISPPRSSPPPCPTSTTGTTSSATPPPAPPSPNPRLTPHSPSRPRPPPIPAASPPPLAADPTPAAAPAPLTFAPPVAAPPVAAPAAATPPANTADAARLIAAFLDGAGVPKLDVTAHDPETYLRDVGALFGTMVESLRDVLMSRAVIKGEFGVEQTMLRPRDNNALKFSVTPSDAVAALLQPGKPGYMQPMRATKEAFDDVRIHQLAVMAGVQAALFNLLKTFDPAELEARLQKGGMIESIVPSSRRAKLWEAFCAKYKDIARDADSDFQSVFGREFARAYTEQAQSK